MTVNERSDFADHRKTDALFFKIYDQYGAIIYRNICQWVDDAALAKELLFKSFMQMHRTLAEMPENETAVFDWMINTSQAVCAEYTNELYGKRRCC